MDIADRIKELRKIEDKTQDEFAKEIKKARTTITGYELRDRSPDPETIKDICTKYDVSADWLLGIIDDRRRLSDLSNNQDVYARTVVNEISNRFIASGLICNADELTDEMIRIVITHGLMAAEEILRYKK